MPEYEIFDLGHLTSLQRLLGKYGLPAGGHVHVDFVMGVPGGMPGTDRGAGRVQAGAARPARRARRSRPPASGARTIDGHARLAVRRWPPAGRHGGHDHLREGPAGRVEHAAGRARGRLRPAGPAPTADHRRGAQCWPLPPLNPGGCRVSACLSRRSEPAPCRVTALLRYRRDVTYTGGDVVAEVVRSGFVEGFHRGSVAVLDAGRRSGGHRRRRARSGLSRARRTSRCRRSACCGPGLSLADPADLALVAASHSGEPMHITRVRAMLAAGRPDRGRPAYPAGPAARRGGPARPAPRRWWPRRRST